MLGRKQTGLLQSPKGLSFSQKLMKYKYLHFLSLKPHPPGLQFILTQYSAALYWLTSFKFNVILNLRQMSPTVTPNCNERTTKNTFCIKRNLGESVLKAWMLISCLFSFLCDLYWLCLLLVCSN